MRKFLLTVLIVVSACSQLPQDQISILEDNSCELPCWNDIIVGQTSEQELVQILSDSPLIDQESLHITNKPWYIFDNQVFFMLQTSNKSYQNYKSDSEVEILDGFVKIVFLCGDLNTTLGEIVELTGEPEGIISGGSISGGRDIIIVNSEFGISYWYNTDEVPKDLELEITPEINVQCLTLFEPAFYETMLEAGMFSMGHYNAEETLKVMYSWDGYGSLDEKYPPRQP